MSDQECKECKGDNGEKLSPKSQVGFGRAPYFQKHYATRVGVTRTEFDVRLNIMNEKLKDDETGEEVLVIDQMVIMTPLAAKELLEDLEKIIKEWEELHPIQPRSDRSIYTKFEVE